MLYRRNRTCVVLGLAGMVLAAGQVGSPAPAPQGDPASTAGLQAPVAPPVAGTATQSPAGPGTKPVLRVTTRLVQVSVVAHDGHGKPVEDLTKDDFRLFDNGQEMKIEFFEKEAVSVTAAGTEVEMTTGTPPVWSNRQGRAGVPVNLTILLWDGLNTKPSDQSRSRQQIIKFLGNIRPEDRIALYALGDDLRVLHDFTSDSSDLLRALQKHAHYNGTFVPANEPPVTVDQSTGNDDLDAFFAGQDATFASYQTQDRVLRTTDALEAIAAHVASLPGRKNLVWVSDSFPLQLDFMANNVGNWEFSENVQRATRALNDANVAVYPVDPRGVTTNLAAVSAPPGPGHTMTAGSLTPKTAGRLTTVTMEEFASLTGGVAYHDTNDLSGAIREAMDDSRLVYTLAYTPQHGEWNNEYRKLKVEVKRSGVHLRYRSGYLATPYKSLDPAQKDHVLAEAQWSPIEASEIGLKFQAQAAPAAGGNPGMRFAILADPAGLRFTEDGGVYAADLVLTLGQKAADGRLVFEETKTLTLRLKDDRYQAVMSKGLRLAGSQRIDPAATEFRVVLLDMSTGRLGSVHVPISKMGLSAPTAPAAPANVPAGDKLKP